MKYHRLADQIPVAFLIDPWLLEGLIFFQWLLEFFQFVFFVGGRMGGGGERFLNTNKILS